MELRSLAMSVTAAPSATRLVAGERVEAEEFAEVCVPIAVKLAAAGADVGAETSADEAAAVSELSMDRTIPDEAELAPDPALDPFELVPEAGVGAEADRETAAR